MTDMTTLTQETVPRTHDRHAIAGVARSGAHRQSSVRTRSGRVRPMTVSDIPEIGQIFFKVFRNRTTQPSQGFIDYFRDVFFSGPSYSEEAGSVVHEDRSGRINGAISAIPMEFAINDRQVTGKLLCAYMEEPGDRSGAAAYLALAMRARLQDLVFTDSAAPVSADHFRVSGGKVLSVQSLEWRRVFRPMRLSVQRLERRGSIGARLGIGALLRPADALVRRLFSGFQPTVSQTLTDVEMAEDAFLDAAPRMISHFALRPVWSRPELSWLLKMASRNASHGPLGIRAVLDSSGEAIGCFVYYGAKGGVARVLNILSLRGREGDVVGQMLSYFDGMGCTSACGMAQPFLMDALLRQRKLVYRYRGYFCIASRHADIRDAVARNDVYIGGLAGETWSRLLTDFR